MLVEQAKYIKADVRKNNNKFWYIELYDNATVITRYGRVGTNGQTREKSFLGQYEAEDFFRSKCREKERSGRNGEIAYRPLNVISDGQAIDGKVINDVKLKDIAKKQIKRNNSIIDKLIEYFTQKNAHNITTATDGQITFNNSTGLFQTPLGIVTQDNIDKANSILANIGSRVAQNDYAFDNLTNDYLMLIPQNVGMTRISSRSFFGTLSAVQRQQSIVDSLQASLQTATAQPVDDSKDDNEVFNVELNLVADSNILDKIKRLYNGSKNTQHTSYNLKVKTVYSVDIKTSKTAFETEGKVVGNINELWHGTRVSNILSILKAGLVIPPYNSSHCTGRMFGNGLYFSDQSTKALNYSYGYWGGSQDNNCFMFLADVAMGKAYSPTNRYGETFPKAGYDSTSVKGGNAGVCNNEMIVYKTSQANLKYLVEFSK